MLIFGMKSLEIHRFRAIMLLLKKFPEPFVLSVPWDFGLAHLTGQGENTQGTDKIKGF